MMNNSKNSPLVYNAAVAGFDIPDVESGQPIKVQGPVKDNIGYIQPPGIDAGIAAFGDVIRTSGDDINGYQNLASKNFARGGQGALNQMTEITNSRQRLSNSILESGGLQATLELVLSYMQMLATEDGVELVSLSWSPQERRKEREVRNITSNDLRHAYSIIFDTSVRRTLAGMPFQDRLALYNLMQSDPDFIPSEVKRILPISQNLLERVVRSPEEQEARQANEVLQNTLQQAGAPAGPPAPGATPAGPGGPPLPAIPELAGAQEGLGIG